MEHSVKLDPPRDLSNQEGHKTVINLSKRFKCTTAQLSLLNKGLNFIPTKGTNEDIAIAARFDLQLYHRKVKLAEFFRNSPSRTITPFTARSTWSPPDSALPVEIKTLIKNDLDYFVNNFKDHSAPTNLTSEETQALSELSRDKNIIIKPADKGSAIVIMDREQYLWEGYRQLGDAKYYSKLDKPIFKETIPQVLKILQTLRDKKFINAKQMIFLRGDPEPRNRIFYMLPKIHKDPEKWSKPGEIPPGRPIVSDCSSETYQTAAYLDYFLNPLSTLHPSYIKDTYHFVDIIKGLTIPQNSLFFTLDIDSLYTNIETTEGLQAVRASFQDNPNKRRPDKELLQLLEINLTKNDFIFNSEYFLQVKGTAMGKKFAPSYANIFMAQWEESALKACKLKPLHYYRYLDDIWGVWTHSDEKFQEFLSTLNTHRESIKIKSTSSKTSVDFLDTTTFKGEKFTESGALDIKVFFKETDTHALLHKTSFHPNHTYAGLIKSQLLRFHRICTQEEDFFRAVKILYEALYDRGYTRTFCRKALKTFLVTKPSLVTTNLPLIVTFSPSTQKLAHACRTSFTKMSKEAKILVNHTIMPAYRKNKNLKDYLIRAKVKDKTASHNSTTTGRYYKHKKWFSNKHTGQVFLNTSKGKISTNNCVYLMSCKKCNLQYVGETGNALSSRFAQHKYNCTNKKNLRIPVVGHLVLHDWAAMRVTIIDHNPRWSLKERRRAERQWITLLGTGRKGDLNER